MATKPKAPAKGKGPGTSVAKTNAGALPVPADFNQSLFLEDAQQGMGFTKDDLAIPFLRILQKGSPEVNKREDKYVEGAEAGQWFNTLTKELWEGEKDGVVVIPCSYTPSYIEWWPRDSKKGTGFVRDYGADASILETTTRDEKTNKNMTAQGTEIVKSGTYYLMVVDPETGDAQQMVLPLSGTQLKKSRQWNSLMRGLLVPRPDGTGKFNPAPFYMSYKLTTVYESNDKGDWFGVAIKPGTETVRLPRGTDLYVAAREFRTMANEGRVKVQPIEEVTLDHDDGEQSF